MRKSGQTEPYRRGESHSNHSCGINPADTKLQGKDLMHRYDVYK